MKNVKALRSLCNDSVSICEDFGGWVADVFLRQAFQELYHAHFIAFRSGTRKPGKKPKIDKRIQKKTNESGMVVDVGAVEDAPAAPLTENAPLVQISRDDSGDVFADPSKKGPNMSMYGVTHGGQMQMETMDDSTEQDAIEEAQLKDFVKLASQFLDELWISTPPDLASSSFDNLPSDTMKSFSLYDKHKIIPNELYSKMSPKFLTLVCVLKGYIGEDGFCGICFAEKRCTAMLLGDVLPRVAALADFARVGSLVGHGSDRSSLMTVSNFSMDISQQKKIVANFRQGKLNLLIATRVAEEGIDIQPCNLVVRFDVVQTVISNIQSRGRARHKNSRYIVMVHENDLDTPQKLHELDKNEAEMNAILLGKDNTSADAPAYVVEHAINVTNETVYETSTGAKMTTFNSVQAIYHYCQTLPHDSRAILKPQFSSGPTLVSSFGMSGHRIAWLSTLQLPINAPPNCRLVSGKPCSSVDDAKRMVALEAVKMLHRAGVFNDSLKLSLYDAGAITSEMDSIEAAQNAFGFKKLGDSPVRFFETYISSIFEVAFPFARPELAPGSVPVLEEPPKDENQKKSEAKVIRPIQVIKRSEVPTSTNGYLLLFEIFEDNAFRLLDLALLTPFEMPADAINGRHTVFTNWKEKEVRIYASHISIPVDAACSNLLQKYSNAIFANALLRTIPPKPDIENEYLLPIVPLRDASTAKASLTDQAAVQNLVDWDALELVGNNPYSAIGLFLKKKHKSGMTRVPILDPKTYDYVKLFQERGDELIVVDRKYYDRRYQVVNVLTDKTPWNQRERKMVLAEFYKRRLFVREMIREDQPVLVAKNIPRIHQTGFTTTKHAEEDIEGGLVYLIPQFCTPFPIQAKILTKSALYIPVLQQYLYHRLSTLDIQRKLGMIGYVPPDLFQTAFIASGSAFLGRSYERHEFLGDSYLKMHLSIHLFANNPVRDEGWLTRSRSALERNSNLLAASIANRLPNALMAIAISRRTWYPPMRFPGTVGVSEKNVADIVEAVIGVCVEGNGIDGGGKSVRRLFSDVYFAKLNEYNSIMPYAKEIFSTLSLMDADVLHGHQMLVVNLTQKTGYKFRNPLLAVEAFTHTSAVGMCDGLTNCFQRLEFLGDAILGFVTAQELFAYPENFGPGALSSLKDEMVNNQYLSVVSYKLGLHTLVKHSSSPLSQDFAEFGARLEEARRQDEQLPQHKVREFFWHSLPHAPKTVSDVLEALIGAVFVDSGCDFDVARKLVERLILADWWEYFAKNGSKAEDVSNPARDVATYAETCCCDEFFVRFTQVGDECTCLIQKHGVVIAKETANSKKLARRLAAIAAAPKLRELAKNGDSNCVCEEKRKENAAIVKEGAVAVDEQVGEKEGVRDLPDVAASPEEIAQSDGEGGEDSDDDVIIM
ncbi:hypothetical protein BC830DRAFT_99023 [Chytriomyces sp. MP71]|nr:hypothetical protein BC830DRAFT_99023 [Chytriomyces sp. MP71]